MSVPEPGTPEWDAWIAEKSQQYCSDELVSAVAYASELEARVAELERERATLREALMANLETMRAVAGKLSSRQPTIAENMLRQRMRELEAALGEEADDDL